MDNRVCGVVVPGPGPGAESLASRVRRHKFSGLGAAECDWVWDSADRTRCEKQPTMGDP